jgi:hypothetical protein
MIGWISCGCASSATFASKPIFIVPLCFCIATISDAAVNTCERRTVGVNGGGEKKEPFGRQKSKRRAANSIGR